MTYVDPPTDSTEARERREAETMDEQQHQCDNGWLGVDQDERPIACPTCRPHLRAVRCWLCSASAGACQMKRDARRGPCCDHCDHRPARHASTPWENR